MSNQLDILHSQDSNLSAYMQEIDGRGYNAVLSLKIIDDNLRDQVVINRK